MILQTIRSVADALKNPTYGVAVQLGQITYDAGDVAPSAPSVIDQTRDLDAALGRYDDQSNTICVFLGESSEQDGEVHQYYRDGSIPVVIRFIRSEVEAATNTSAVFYVLHAVERALRVWLSSTSEADRIRSNILVMSCSALNHDVLVSDTEDPLQVGMIRATFAVRDINA